MIKALYNVIDTAIVLGVGVFFLVSFRNASAPKMYKKKWCLWGGIFMVCYAVFLLVDRFIVGH